MTDFDAYDPGDPKSPTYLDSILDSERDSE